jgi:uroporphyrin-III C-methyltransferase/precorrin-2 dehydrogenase/sirohydrochlorin ferrochelatase
MKHLPLFFDVTGRTVIVVGRGDAAERRAALARAAGAAVRRIQTIGLADLKDVVAAFVATGDAETDRLAAEMIRKARVPVNVADRPALSDFIVPAIIDRDEVVVAVSTGGASPTVATMLRARIEALLPERIAALARLTGSFRGQVKGLIGDPAVRRAFWRRVVDGPAGHLALAGNDAGARRAVLGDLDAARHARASRGAAHVVCAGPGDPDLLTLQAARLLQEADAILHDERVPRAVLGRARRDAELIRIGPRNDRTGWTQKEITRRVRAGQIVVRLKAGLQDQPLAQVS